MVVVNRPGKGLDAISAAVVTGRLRLRPVFLTAFTTVLGLMPMVLAMNIDQIHCAISFGAPSTQWWTQSASAIAGGLSFDTVLTLMLTPCLLVLGDQGSQWMYSLPARTATVLMWIRSEECKWLPETVSIGRPMRPRQ
jgi:Cu/Ag efflux pump CusA